MLAASAGNLECLEALLDHGADASIASPVDSKTPLDISVAKGHKAVAERLKRASTTTSEL
jgi:ankyrin repeat protein